MISAKRVFKDANRECLFDGIAISNVVITRNLVYGCTFTNCSFGRCSIMLNNFSGCRVSNLSFVDGGLIAFNLAFDCDTDILSMEISDKFVVRENRNIKDYGLVNNEGDITYLWK